MSHHSAQYYTGYPQPPIGSNQPSSNRPSGNNTNSVYNSYNSAPSLAPAPSQNGRYSRIFALTIAINVYTNQLYDPLRGCVADAEAIEHFLVSDLGIDPRRIRRLRDAQATRANIISEFERLSAPSQQNSIHSGDPIIIYYAGHGAEIKPPDGWPEDKNIQMIIPHDCEQRVSSTQVIHGIPDVTIQGLLNKIADAKGDNITVIFDNCHSGSGTRDASDAKPYVSRAVSYHNRASFVPTLDGYTFPINTFDSIHSGHNSHVLLAACNSREKAREIHGRGLFTKALLEAMRMPDIRNVTYKELLMKLARLPKDQNPQCEGRNQDRLLFTTQVRSRPFNTTFDAKPSGPNSLRISAGLSHWLNKDDVLNYWIRGDDPQQVSPRGQATISKVNYADSIATTTNQVQQRDMIFTQLFRSAGTTDLLLYISSGDEMRIVKNAITQVVQLPAQHRASLKPVRSQDDARLIIHRDNQAADYRFRYNDSLTSRYSLSNLRFKAPPNTSVDAFHVIFDKITAYEYYLRRREEVIINKVSIGIHRIKPNGDLDGVDLNSHGTGLDLVHGGSFAIKIHNYMSRDLYPALFYFDNLDFSIQPIYIPPFAGAHVVDLPLKAKSTLTLGYGSEGSLFVADVKAPKKMECGYIKLFISTAQVDFSGIRQSSAFVTTRGLAPPREPKVPQFFWSLVVPFVARSKDPSVRTRSGPNETSDHSGYSTRSTPTATPPPDYQDVVDQLQHLDVSNRYSGSTRTRDTPSGSSAYHGTYNDRTTYFPQDRGFSLDTASVPVRAPSMSRRSSSHSSQSAQRTVRPSVDQQYYDPPQEMYEHERSISNTTNPAYQRPLQLPESYYQAPGPPYPTNRGLSIIPVSQRSSQSYGPRSVATLPEPQPSQPFCGNDSTFGISSRHNQPSRSTTLGTQPYPSPPWPIPAYGHQESLYPEESHYRTTPPLPPPFPVPSHQGTLENFPYIPTVADEEGEHVQYGGVRILPEVRRRY